MRRKVEYMMREFTQIEPLTLARVSLPDGGRGCPVSVQRSWLARRFPRSNERFRAAERERASRFHFARDRERFVVARGLLRRILAGYLDMAAGEIEFHYAAAGKPELAWANPDDAIRFNLSHFGELGLVAVVARSPSRRGRREVRDGKAPDDVARRFFHPREVASLAALTAAGRRQTFYRYWTRKEAFLKARGDGLSAGLAALDTSGLCGTPWKGRPLRRPVVCRSLLVDVRSRSCAWLPGGGRRRGWRACRLLAVLLRTRFERDRWLSLCQAAYQGAELWTVSQLPVHGT